MATSWILQHLVLYTNKASHNNDQVLFHFLKFFIQIYQYFKQQETMH